MDPTEIVVTSAVVALLVWEGISLVDSRDRVRTISDVVSTVARRNPILILLIGILLGHWLWQFCPPCP